MHVEEYVELDARQYPIHGISLHTTKFRHSRLYYLNLLTEFALRLFAKAGVPAAVETFTASHCVDHAYIPLASVPRLQGPLVVVNGTDQPLVAKALHPFLQWQHYLGTAAHMVRTVQACCTAERLKRCPPCRTVWTPKRTIWSSMRGQRRSRQCAACTSWRRRAGMEARSTVRCLYGLCCGSRRRGSLYAQ